MIRSLLFSLLICSSLDVLAITVGSYNIRNFDYDNRYQIRTNKPKLATILSSLNADLLGVQEINNTAEFERFIAQELPEHDVELSRCGGAHGQRLGFVFNKSTIELLSFNEDLSIVNPGSEGTCNQGSRPLAIGLFRIKASGQKFYAMSAHLKSGSNSRSIETRHEQFQVLKNIVIELRSKTGVQNFMLTGDINTTEYINGGVDAQAFNKILAEVGMSNLTHNLKCSAYWWGGTDDGIETPSLLDHVAITPGLRKKSNAPKIGTHCQAVACKAAPIRELGVSYESVSDHCPITVKIQ